MDAEGQVHVPRRPGLGVDVDWALLERHALQKL